MQTTESTQRITGFQGLSDMDSETGHFKAYQNQLRHVKRIINRWLPASSTFALWVNDMTALGDVVEQLHHAYIRLIGFIEASYDVDQLQICDQLDRHVADLHDSAVELDRFLRREAIGLQTI